MAKLMRFNKPFRVLSQFTDHEGRSTLADFINITNLYPAGRLDFDSEGLLLLTNNGPLQARISHPKHKLTKAYWVQVEGTVTEAHCRTLCKGVTLKDGPALALSCKPISAPDIWSRTPPIRVRKTLTDSWLEMVINEGRNRQVRRMTAAVNLPTLRLIRYRVGDWHIGDLEPGQFQMSEANLANISPATHGKKYR